MRLPRSLIPVLALVLSAAPALAQEIDFGWDTSDAAYDGECNDPRFQGLGMAQGELYEGDILADANDCRAAYEGGIITLADAVPQDAGNPDTANPEPMVNDPVPAGLVEFGDDTGEYANDGECDDRRFTGMGMATVLTWANTGRDGTDCRVLYEEGSIRLWRLEDARAAAEGLNVTFGTDEGEFAMDGECDDMLFEGFGMANPIGSDMIDKDATDCAALYAFGAIGLRDF